MSKINQIQNALMELDGGAFQKLADSYLLAGYYSSEKGYRQINPIGSVAGSNKVKKGTPDSLILTDDGKYVFCEYTTSKKEVCSKFSDDIAKCLDENKTGIAIVQIKEIVLCYTSELSKKEINILEEQCEKSKIHLNIFGLGKISNDLFGKYPRIAKGHLGIEVDTGQVLTLDEFITRYERHTLATTLQTKFHFRKDEKKDLLTLLQDNDLVIISGKAGVGKSRLAIECYRQFKQENESYKAFCLFNKGIDLFEDIRSYFSASDDFLIFVDDANRISGFEYIVYLLLEKRKDQNFKILVTVRDYALDKIKEICKSISGSAEIKIERFTDEEIKSLLKDEFEIDNYLFLDRIVEIAQGNPRLAVMAAQIAKESNTFESIRDVTELYDEYYSSIKGDLDTLKDGDILKVAAIVSFFITVDKTNDDLMSIVENVCDISKDDFWEASKKLHDMEILEMLEDEVVRVSDQVLSTYIFYLVFFKEKRLNFSILINDELFPKCKPQLIDAISPLLNTFNVDEIKKVMEPEVDKIWDVMQGKIQSSNEDNFLQLEDDFLQLIDVFWSLKKTDTLIYIQDKINSIDGSDIDLGSIRFESNSNTSLPKFLSILPKFRCLDGDQCKLSLDLLLQYAEKQPNDTPTILHCLLEEYGFRPASNLNDYDVQHGVIDKLLEYSCSGSNEYFTRLFIALAGSYLNTHFYTTNSGRTNTIIFTEFDLNEYQSLRNLREKILKKLFDLFNNNKYQKHILKLFMIHGQSGLYVFVADIIENDSKLILPFFSSMLDPNDICNCIVVQQYLRLLKRLNIQTDESLKEKFQSLEYDLYDLLANNENEIMSTLGYDAYREYKNKEIDKLTASYSAEDYDKILHQLYEIQQALGEYSQLQINQGVFSIVLENLSKRDANLSCKVIKRYLEQGDYLEISPWETVSNMLLKCEVSRVFDIINTPEYSTKNRWLFKYYWHLPNDKIQKKHMDAICELYKNSDIKYFIPDADYLLKYEGVKKGFVAEILEIIMQRASFALVYAHPISQFFRPHTKIYENIHSVFSGHFTLLEDAYMAVDRVSREFDYDGKFLAILIDNNQTFINRYLEHKFSRNDYLSSYNDSRDYSFIWMRDDYDNVMKRISSVIFGQECKRRYFRYYGTFFRNTRSQVYNSTRDRQNKYLINEIETKFDENEYMRFLFSVISGFQRKRKLIFYKSFLDKNKELDDFKKIPFDLVSSWVGSAVPMLQERISFYEEIMQLCNSIELIRHRQFIEQRIQGIRDQIQSEKRGDFTKDY